MALGVPVAFSFITVNLVGAFFFMGGFLGLDQLVDNATFQVTRFTLVPVPLFLLMGELFFHSGLAIRAFDALDAGAFLLGPEIWEAAESVAADCELSVILSALVGRGAAQAGALGWRGHYNCSVSA